MFTLLRPALVRLLSQSSARSFTSKFRRETLKQRIFDHRRLTRRFADSQDAESVSLPLLSSSIKADLEALLGSTADKLDRIFFGLPDVDVFRSLTLPNGARLDSVAEISECGADSVQVKVRHLKHVPTVLQSLRALDEQATWKFRVGESEIVVEAQPVTSECKRQTKEKVERTVRKLRAVLEERRANLVKKIKQDERILTEEKTKTAEVHRLIDNMNVLASRLQHEKLRGLGLSASIH